MHRLEYTKNIANGGVVTIAVTILLSALFWFLPVYVFPEDCPPVISRFMGIELFSIPFGVSRVLAFVFWLAIWFIVNDKCEKAHIIPVRSIMPLVIGMAVVSAISQLQYFDFGMIAFLFFLSALMTIFNLYTVSNQVNESFRAIFFILISSLFVPEYIWMFVLFFLGLAVFKVRSSRIFISISVALLVFVWMVWGVCFVIGKVPLFYAYLASLVDFNFFNYHGNVVHIAGLVLMFITMLIMIIAVIGISNKYDARVRLNRSFINMSFFFSTALMVAAKGFNTDLLMIVVLMITLLSALYFSTQRSNFSNILFLVVLVLLVAYRVADGLIKIEI